MSTALWNLYQKQTYFLHLTNCFPFYVFYLSYSFRQMFRTSNAAYETLKLSGVKQVILLTGLVSELSPQQVNLFLLYSVWARAALSL